MNKVNILFFIIILQLITVLPILAIKPTISIKADPASIYKGEASKLTWTSTGATSASINQGIGSVPLNGSLTVSPNTSTTYTITARNSSGYRNATVKVTVKPVLPVITFTASPATILSSQSSTLSWTTSNASSVYINQGIGTVALSGSKTVSPSVTTTYTLTATGSGRTVTATTTITVTKGPPVITFSASPTSIQEDQGSRLNWTTTSATSVTIEPNIGSTGLNGTATVFPTQTTIYKLTAIGPGGISNSQVEVQVQVAMPTVTLSANPTTIQAGESATLSWSSRNATSAILDNGIGMVELSDSMQVSPTSTTTYTITVTGPGGSQTASATLIISSGIRYYAYIPDCSDNKIRIIDTITGVIKTSIDILGTATNLQGVNTDPLGVYTYIAETGSTRIIKIDPLTMTKVEELVLTANFQGKPKHIALSPDGCYLYATSSVPLWNPASGKYVGAICAIKTSGDHMTPIRGVNIELPHQISLEGLTVSPDNSRIFVADPDNNQILVLAADEMHRYAADMVAISNELITAIPIASPPLGISYSPNGQSLYVFADSMIYEIDALNLTVNRSVAVPSGNRFMKVHPDGSKIYVVTREYVSIIEAIGFSKTATKSIAGLYYCTGFDVHPDGSRLFFVDKTSDKLITADSSTYQVVFNTTVGTDPAAFGSFLGHLPITIGGNVTRDGNGLTGVTMTLDGDKTPRTKQTGTAGDYMFGLRPGDYKLTPTMSNLAFSPETLNLHVTESLNDLDFAVSGIVHPPTVSLTSSSEWVNPYETFTLSWNSTGADYVSIEIVTSDHLPPSGLRNFALQSTTTICAVAYNRGGTASASVKIYVSEYEPPTVTISANPSLIQQGGSSTLTWSTTRAASVTIDNGIGTVTANGSKIVSPSATTIYTITATHVNGFKITSNATVSVSEFDTSAKLIGTVTDFDSGQPVADACVCAADASGTSQTTITDSLGKYSVSNLRVGNVTVSFSKVGYDANQQTIQIPANTTYDLIAQLHATLVGATLKGIVKDGLTNQPIAGASVFATYSGTSQAATSATDGAYVIAGIPLGVNATITASYAGYGPRTIQQSFLIAKIYNWDFVIYDASSVATIIGKITNAKTLLPEEGVKVTCERSNAATVSAADGAFIFSDIPFGEQSFYFEKADFIEETYTCAVDHSPFSIDLTKPSSDGGEIAIGQNISGFIQDAVSQNPLPSAIVRIPGIGLQAVTDASGRYQLATLPIGTYPLQIIAHDHMALNFTVHVNIDQNEQVDFALIPLSRGLIQGIVTDTDTGSPIREASLEIEGSTMLGATSAGDGTYKMVGTPSGSYTIQAIHSEYEFASVANVVVKESSQTTVDLKLKKRTATGALEGRILDISTGNPLSGATVTAVGPGISTTSTADGYYRLENIPAGLNDIIVSATGYPDSPRIRSVLANKDSSSISTVYSDINVDAGNSQVDEAVTVVIKKNEGGDAITPDGRFMMHIFPETLSADAKLTLKIADNGLYAPIGSELPLDPALKLSGIRASSIMTQIELAATNAGDPAPTINGMAVFAARYSQTDIDAFHLDEDAAFIYSWNGIHFTALDLRPFEFAVDKVNNIVFSTMDLTRTMNGSTMQYPIKSSGNPDLESNGKTSANPTKIMINIIGNSIINTIYPPKANIKIFDKNELVCVAAAPDDRKPNPNALPLLVLHGFDPKTLLDSEKETTNPNEEDRYRLMLEDIIDATNGVYRPIFVSYNTKAKIKTIAQALAGELLGNFLDQHLSLKGLPSDPSNPESGTFPYLDTFGFSMGGLVSRAFIFYNRTNRVRSMTMIGTPNHGVFNCMEYIFEKFPILGGIIHVLRPHNFGAADMLEYDDSSPDGLSYNPFLFKLNSPPFSSLLAPRGDINLYAGTDEGAWLGVPGALMPSPNDSLVTVKSVFCRPTNSTLESKQSLLKVLEPRARKYEHTKAFSHADIGTLENRIRDFSEELAKGFSDWVVGRVYNETPSDNAFVKPTRDAGGFIKSKVKVEYNTWMPDAERQARDFDRVVLVIYHKDGNGHWHISDSKGGENGADPLGKVNESKIETVKGNSIKSDIGPRILIASVNFAPNPPKGEPDYDPENDIRDAVSLVIPLAPGKMNVPLDPSKVHFRTPGENEWQ